MVNVCLNTRSTWDIDLWSGGVSERPLPGSMAGPTFACIIATQFSYARRGDRFWYELPNQPSSFSPGTCLKYYRVKCQSRSRIYNWVFYDVFLFVQNNCKKLEKRDWLVSFVIIPI